MVKQVTAVISVLVLLILASCATGAKVKIVELENKGTALNVPAPDWIKIYTGQGISKVQALSEFKDKYCIIGEETGTNRQFVLAWADSFSAQQRIGAMLRTTISSEYQAKVQGSAQSTGGANSSSAEGAGSGQYQQEIDNVINSVVNVSYSGAQREADWWSLRRRYDPDVKDVYTDEYTAYVLYTIPKGALNQQVATALETSVKADSALYAITIEMAKQILQNGIANWGVESANNGTASSTSSVTTATSDMGTTATISVNNGAPSLTVTTGQKGN